MFLSFTLLMRWFMLICMMQFLQTLSSSTHVADKQTSSLHRNSCTKVG